MFRFGDPGGRAYNAVGTSNANLLSWWTGGNNASTAFTITTNGGRSGSGNSLHFIGTGGQARYLSKTLDAQATWGIAFAIKASNFGPSANNIFALVDVATAQLDLRVNPDGTLSVTRNGTVLGTTTIALASNVWTHVEWKSLIAASPNGTTEIRINGVVALSLTGQNTRATANNSASIIVIGNWNAAGAGQIWDYDDIIIYDGQTNDANGYSDITGPIGDCRLTWLLPTANGSHTDFTLTGAASNAAAVNEAQPDTGTGSYVESSTVGQFDTYAAADTAASSLVKSVAICHYARKTDAGSRGITAMLHSGSTDAAHATPIALGDSYQYYFSNYGRDPNGAAAWAAAAVNAMEIGQKLTS